MNTIQINNLSIDEFKELLETSFEQIRSNTPTKEAKDREQTYATRKEAAAALHVSLPTLSQLVSRGEIPAYRLGGRVLLKWTEIDGALKRIAAKKYPQAQ